VHRCHTFWKVGDEPRRLNHITQIDTIEMIGTIGTVSKAENSPQSRLEGLCAKTGASGAFGEASVMGSQDHRQVKWLLL